jgi:uncharacterized Tic20 family protein
MDANTTNLKPTPGPELLNERPITGIVVHLLALATGIVGAGLVYLASSHAYTRENARNALNWHLTVLVLSVAAFVTFFLGADTLTVAGDTVQWSPLPGPVDTVVGLVGMVLLFLAALSWLLTWVFGLVATAKAVFGNPWAYPLARDFLEEDG